MTVYSYSKQVRAVLAIEAIIIATVFGLAIAFWSHLCDDTLESCLATGTFLRPLTFLLIAALRPFVFTPFLFMAVISGKAFGPWGGTFLSTLGGVASGMLVFMIAKYAGRRLVKPWLRSNLPATLKFIRSQDYKIVFALRLVPFLPFDLASAAFGALDFRARSVALGTLFGALPEAYLFAKLVDPSETLLDSTLISLGVLGACLILPLLAFEFLSRKRGTGMWQTLRAMYREIHYEVQSNNDIVKRQIFDPKKTPVLLLYGFFSSRRAVTVLEKMLTARGHQVLSFNLGGLMGTFFTRDILETANFIDYKIKRQIERHGFKNIHVVAHSKGGMVALWWALKLGGHKHCDKVVTMGTPFNGSILTYLALVTPLGLLWRDMGQMRPGSMFLKSLNDAEVPDGLKIYCLHSTKDRVASGKSGIFRPRRPSANIISVAMNEMSHFEFLYRRDVGEAISRILLGEAPENAEPAPPASDVPLSMAPESILKSSGFD